MPLSLESNRARSKVYYAAHKEEIKDGLKIANRKGRWVVKIETLTYYSDKAFPSCKHCGEVDVRVLQIDHIDGNGSTHRKQIGKNNAANFYRWLKRNNYPEGFQVLCANCNMRKKYDDLQLYFPEGVD